MPTLKVEESLVESLFNEEYEGEEWKLESKLPWIGDGKYSYGGIVVKRLPTKKYYMASLSRSGSYHSEYNYHFDDLLVEVELQIVTKKDWVAVP